MILTDAYKSWIHEDVEKTIVKTLNKFVTYSDVNKSICYTSQLKYVFWLEENVSRVTGQNFMTPLGEQNFITPLGPVSRKFRELFGPEKLVVKLQSACFEKLIFLHVFNIRKIKRTAKFECLEPRRCKGIKTTVAPETAGPKSFGTCEKQAPGQQ